MFHSRSLRVPSAHIRPERVVNYDCATIGQCLDRVAHITGHDPHQTRSNHLLHAVYGQFEFTFDDLVDFFLRDGNVREWRSHF
jgi:hypothetical protein